MTADKVTIQGVNESIITAVEIPAAKQITTLDCLWFLNNLFKNAKVIKNVIWTGSSDILSQIGRFR